MKCVAVEALLAAVSDRIGPIADNALPRRLSLGCVQLLPIASWQHFVSDVCIERESCSSLFAAGLCPGWADWDPNQPMENAREAMQQADDWLGVPQVGHTAMGPTQPALTTDLVCC